MAFNTFKTHILKDQVIIGRKPVLDCLKSQTDVEKVWISKTLKGDIEKDIRALTREQTIPLQYVPTAKLNSLSRNKNHQGLVAQISLVQYMSLEEVIPFLYEQGKVPAFLVLEGIEDVRNIGALARSAVWFGFDAIVISLKRTARINSIAYKTSAGALKDIIICREQSMIKSLELLKASGVKLVIADLGEPSKSIGAEVKEPIALVLGSEGKGPSAESKAFADAFITIPGTNKVDSLNVSVAGAILMHEFYKIRNSI